MKMITVGQLRQNPTSMLADVEAGETYQITRHNQVALELVQLQALKQFAVDMH